MDLDSGIADHSGEQGETNKEKVHEIPWSLKMLRQDHRKEKIQGELLMPSQIPRMFKDAWISPSVMLDLHANDDKVLHGLSIMRDSTSKNILHARLIIEGASRKGAPAPRILAWVEPFAGNLLDYLISKRLGIPLYKDAGSKIVLPTPILGLALSQALHGFENLMMSGHYHGNFSLARTYYVIDEKTSEIEVKLCNFREKKGGSYDKYLAEDWRAILAGLKQIHLMADGLKSEFSNLDCSQLDGLIHVMEDINKSNAVEAFKVIKRQPFFWGREERTQFLTHDIPIALDNHVFLSKVKNAESIVLPWDENDFHGLLKLMNQYQLDRMQDEYDTKSRIGLVKFVSALYTHELELERKYQRKMNVDVIIKEELPDLCYMTSSMGFCHMRKHGLPNQEEKTLKQSA